MAARPPNSPRERVAALLERVVGAWGLDAEVEVTETGDELIGTLSGSSDLALAIGRHGQTIDALQHLAARIAYKGATERKRVVIDAEGYRARRAEALARQADRAASEARRYGRAVALDDMTAAERRIVHEHLRDDADVETHSEGEEPHRHLVVSPLP